MIPFTSANDFNPRSREGSDNRTTKQIFTNRNFNPRSREGSDVIKDKLTKSGKISIHAPAKGATFNRRRTIMFDVISIHAPAKGATFWVKVRRRTFQISIHAPAKGATSANFSSVSKSSLFQSTLPRRERRTTLTLYHVKVDFNPRSREGSDSNIIQQISFSLYNTVYFVSNNIK